MTTKEFEKLKIEYKNKILNGYLYIYNANFDIIPNPSEWLIQRKESGDYIFIWFSHDQHVFLTFLDDGFYYKSKERRFKIPYKYIQYIKFQ